MNKEEIIANLMTLALEIESKTEKCVFINYHGHVNWLEIRISESVKSYNKWIGEFMVYFNEPDFIEVYNKIVKSLNQYLV